MPSRRLYLKSIGTAGVVGGSLAGCSMFQEQTQPPMESRDQQTESRALDILHPWTTSNEKDAAENLFSGFQRRYPETEIDEQTVAGRVGGDLQTTVKKQIIDGDPPSLWPTWGGMNLRTYVDGGALTQIGEDFWSEKTEWSLFPENIRHLSKVDDSYVAVPLSIHRLNNLFYNIEILEDVGIDPKSIDDPQTLLNAVETVEEESDAKGLVHATKTVWPTLELWESILLGEFGEKAYESVVNGNIRSNERAVRDSLELVEQYRKHSPSTIVPFDWRKATKRFLAGDIAFFHQGDWAAAAFRGDDEFVFRTNWGHVAFPGTADQFLLSLTSFPFPKHSRSTETTTEFLQYVGSRSAQKEFAQRRGAIPSRRDVPKAEFSRYFRRQIRRFRGGEGTIPSIAHGLAVAPAPQTKLTKAMEHFTSTWNVDQTTQKILRIFE